MQRLFAMFPPAGPGIGLLILRIAVAAALLRGAGDSVGGWIPAVAATGLLAGALTPILAALGALLHLAPLASGAGADAGALAAGLSSAALALLGPGAYSVDAHLYGRRRVVSSHDPHE